MEIPLPTIKGIPGNFQLFRKGKLQKIEACELWNGIWAWMNASLTGIIHHTLWNWRLLSKGMTLESQVDLAHVSVFRHMGNKMSAMLSLRVSAAPLATQRQ